MVVMTIRHLIDPGPVDDAGKHSHRAGAPNHHHNSGSGRNLMVDATPAGVRVAAPVLAADVVLFARDPGTGETCVLLVERGRDPYAGCWALPGGRCGAG